ncbi:hypothetical protein GCM10023189_10860 [Nibrella saemangeumensis]|uniref:Uncharacterized protein n=1 Tax=Nibrella saemangeumensis TaxID=1084526 RepID=A0ABP8MJ10_9BACT
MHDYKSIYTTMLLFVATLCSVFAQDNSGVARVEKIQGVETYVMSEPLREYDVAFKVETGLKMASLATGGVVNEGVSDKAEQFIRHAVKQGKKDNKEFDAVLISGSKTAVAIKFKTQATEQNKGLARVKKVDGYELYVLSEPVREYDRVVDATGGLKAKSYFTSGLVNNSIEEDMAQFVKRVKKEAAEDKKDFEAVIYSGGKSAIGVKFKG